MARQNPGLLPSAANLLAAAGSIRAALSAGDFDGLKKGLTSAADGFEQAGAAIAVVERRLRDLGEPNVDLSGRSAAVVVSGDRIRGGIPVQGVLPNVAGQSLDLTFASQVAHVTSMDHGTGGYLELDLDGLGVTINAHGGTITLTGTISLSAPLTVPMGGTGTATGSITGTGDLTFAAGGSNKTVALVSSGTGKVVAKPGTDSTTAIQLQNAAGTAVVNVDTTNGNVGIAATAVAGTAITAGRTYLTVKGTSLGGILELVWGGADGTGNLIGQLVAADPNITGADKRAVAISMATVGATANNRGAALAFFTKADAGALTEGMRIDNAQNVLIGTATTGASRVRIVGLPTSAAGLSAGDVWSNAGVLTIA